MLERIRFLAKKKTNFAFETTMASRNFVPFLNQCKQAGYQVNLIFFWLENPELAMKRVADRVRQGGHDIPEEVIIRRYKRGLENFVKLYLPLADDWVLYDNSYERPNLIARANQTKVLQIAQEEIWSEIIGTIQ